MAVFDIISGSMRLLGLIAQAEQPTASEAQDALYSLNSMLDSWKLEKLMAYAILPTSFPFVAGQKSYTIGPSGNWAMTPRPYAIEKVTLTYTTNSTTPLNLDIEIINLDQYQAFIVPGTSSSIPMWVYIDDGFPLRTAYFYNVPSTVNVVNLFTWQQIEEFTAVTQNPVLPPGYERAIRYNLALEMAAEYGVEPSETVAAGALTAKAAIKAYNMKPLYMQADAALTGRKTGFNWLTGE